VCERERERKREREREEGGKVKRVPKQFVFGGMNRKETFLACLIV